MKTERAIELLNRISDSQFDGIHGDERREALEMAVRALKGDGDTIYRQAAIDAYGDWYVEEGTAEGFIGTVKQLLEGLPSAQPEVLSCELVQESDSLVKDLVKDCISRQQAIDEVINLWADKPFGNPTLIEIKGCIEALPSAQPEPQWIPTKVKPDPDLPEDDMSGYFLVTLHTYGNIGFDMDEYEVKKMRWDRVNGWGFPVHSPAWIEEALTQEVLAWKPCPEPYREDGVE